MPNVISRLHVWISDLALVVAACDFALVVTVYDLAFMQAGISDSSTRVLISSVVK